MDDQTIERLLRAGAASDAELDAVLGNVLEKTERRRGWTRWPSLLTTGFAAVAASMAIRLVWPVSHQTETPITLRAKGAAHGPSVSVDCTGGSLQSCPRGSRLVFRVSSRDQAVHIVAFAERDGRRIVYFPAVGQSPPRLDAGPARFVEQAVVIGPEHEPGDYRLNVLAHRRTGAGRGHRQPEVPRRSQHAQLELRVLP